MWTYHIMLESPKRQRKRKNNNEGFNNLHIISLFVYMHCLKYVRLNRQDRLNNMLGTTLEVAMRADVSGAYRAISNVLQCVTGPL